MRSELGKECRKLFRKMMATEFPEYQEDKGQIVPPGWYVWSRQHPSRLWFYILVVIHPTRDQFTNEAAWGFSGTLPRTESAGRRQILEQPQLFRPNYLWSGKDYWWSLFPDPERPRTIRESLIDDPIEQCLPLVAPAVSDAAKKLKEHLIPVFEKIAEKHGDGPKTKGGSQQPQEQS
jgi:hypothetical protein